MKNQESQMEHFYIFKGVDDFLEVTIVDKGEQDEKQQIGRCQIFLQIIFSNFEIPYSDPGSTFLISEPQ